MSFDIVNFANEFKNAIDWMLKGEYGQRIRDEIRIFKNNRRDLNENPDSLNILKLLIEVIVTQSWYYKKRADPSFSINSTFEEYLRKSIVPSNLMKVFGDKGYNLSNPQVEKVMDGMWRIVDNDKVYIIEKKRKSLIAYYSEFDTKIDNFIKRYGSNFRGSQDQLIDLVGSLAPDNIKNKVEEKMRKLLGYNSLRDFTEELYKLAKERKTIVLGEKGRDDYLRDVGYWDRAPIDRHEMRFLIRTGIYHTYKDSKKDPLKKTDLLECLSNFCSTYLRGFKVEGIDLGEAPGIVDMFIWSFSAKDRYNKCGATPQCSNCILKDVCLYNTLQL